MLLGCSDGSYCWVPAVWHPRQPQPSTASCPLTARAQAQRLSTQGGCHSRGSSPATSVLLQAIHNLHSIGYSILDPHASNVKVSVDKGLYLQLQLRGKCEPSGTGRQGASACSALHAACTYSCNAVHAASRSEGWNPWLQMATRRSTLTLGSLPALSWQHP